MILTDIARKEPWLVFCLYIWEKLRHKVYPNPTERTWEMRAQPRKKAATWPG